MKNPVLTYLLILVLSIFTANKIFSQIPNSKKCNITEIARISSLAQQYEEDLKYDSAIIFYKKAGNCYEQNEIWLNCVKNYRLTSENYLVIAKYDSALSYSKKAFDIAEKHFSPTSKNQMLEKADVLLTFADIHEKEGKYKEELSSCKKALEITLKADSTDSLRIAKIWDITGIAYKNVEKYDSAFLFCNNALNLKTKILGNEHLNIATSYTNIGSAFDSKGEYDKALEYYQKALNIINKTSNKNPLQIAHNYHHIGIIFSRKGEYVKALSYYQKALEIRILHLTEKHPDIADSYNNVGIVYLYKGEYDKALEYYQEALKISNEILGEANPRSFSFYINIGIIYLYKGEYDKALEFYQKARKLYIGTYGEIHTRIAIIDNNIGLAYSYKGEYDKALEYFQKAINIYVKTLGKDHPDIAISYLYTGLAYNDKEEYDLALEYYQKALKIRINTLGEKYSGIGYDYNNIGGIYSAKAKYDRALEYFEKSLEINIDAFGEQHQSVSENYCAIGIVYKYKQEYNKALDYFQKALKIYIEIIGKQHPDVTHVYNNIGEVNCLQGEYSKAIHNFHNGLKANFPNFIDTSVYSNRKMENALSKPVLLNSLTGKANAFFMLYKHKTNAYSDLETSLSTYELAFQLTNNMRNEYNIETTKLLLSENTKNNYAKAVFAAIEFDSINRSPAKEIKTFDFIERGKSSTLAALFNESHAVHLAGIPDSLIHTETNLKRKINDLKTKIDNEKYKKQGYDTLMVNELENKNFTCSRKLDSLISSFESAYPNYYELKYANKTVTIPDIQKELNNQTAILNYFISDSVLFIVVLTDSLYRIEKVPVNNSFKDLILGYYQDIRSAERETFIPYSQLIFEKVIQPAKKHIALKNQLIIIPDDYLNYLPFETLVDKSVSTVSNPSDFSKLNYLVHSYSIQYHKSATLWYNSKVKETHKSEIKDSFIGFAPVFSKKANNGLILSSNSHAIDTTGNQLVYRSISNDNMNFNPLPYSEKEVVSIVKIFEKQNKQATAYLYSQASESNFKKNAGKYQYVHISSHGFSNDYSPNLSGLVFSQNNADSTEGDKEDGILFAGETYSLQLNADLLVLSSCESGMGKLIRGEGLITLARGFLYSGTPNIVYSLWKVPDKSTNVLMQSFYEYVLKGHSYSDALRLAKLDMINNEKYAFPLFWSGFVMIGR